jgi:hypothetical protein
VYKETAQIYHPLSDKCLTGRGIHEEVFLEKCDEKINQKWTFGVFNKTALNNWDITGVKYN